jgi:hypothetical protein
MAAWLSSSRTVVKCKNSCLHHQWSVGHISAQLGIAEGAVEGVDAAVKLVLEEPTALEGEVLWSVEWGATRAE